MGEHFDSSLYTLTDLFWPAVVTLRKFRNPWLLRINREIVAETTKNGQTLCQLVIGRIGRGDRSGLATAIAVARTTRSEGRRRFSSLLGRVRTESIPPNQVRAHSLTMDLPRVTSTIIIGSGRCSFPEKSRAGTKSLHHFPDHYRHLERTKTHRDCREKQRLCSHIQYHHRPLRQGQLVKSSPRWHGSRRAGIEDYREAQVSLSLTPSCYSLKSPPTRAS